MIVNRYQHLDEQKAKVLATRETNPSQSFEDSSGLRVKAFGNEDRLSWIYGNVISKTWRGFLAGQKEDAGS